MGFVIWYQVQIPGAGAGGLSPLRVSNDVFSGEYILDADIRVDLVAGAAASTFRVTLTNLPADVADTLKSMHKQAVGSRQPLPITVRLGYFDDPASQLTSVLDGVITHIRGRVDTDGSLVTELGGYERAGYRLRCTPVSAHRPGSASLDEFVADVKRQTGVDAKAVGLPRVQDYTLRSDSGLEALRRIADTADAPLVISDGTVLMGQSVGLDGPVTFSAKDNIVQLDQLQEDDDDACAATALPADALPRTSLDLTVLGDPSLRVGQRAILIPADPRDALPGALRTDQVQHIFSTRTGYTCRVVVVVADPGHRARRPSGVHRVVDRFRDLTESASAQRPAVDVGEVASYEPGSNGKHLATLRYGQSPPADAVAPSVELSVDPATQLHSKPVASPFAFHRCGLTVPVLPGMRAVLAHNRGLVNDAVVTGFLWAEQPRQDPPKNEAGDWWLCLPTSLDGQGLPTGKGVNDLTDKTGLRVIQAKGLKISVGDAKLPEVGERPSVPSDLGNTLVIENGSDTTVTIAGDGAVTIDTKGKDIKLSNGSASITLTGGTVKLHGTSVEVG